MALDAEFFRNNRTSLAEKLAGGLFSVTAYTRQQRGADMPYKFEQESNFWYLTGINEPEWKLVYDGITHHSWLVMPDISEVHRIFDGGLSAEQAKHISGVHSVISHDELLPLYRRLARTHSLAYTIGPPRRSENFNFVLNPALSEHQHQLERNFAKVQQVNKELAQLRSIKQPDEISAIRDAINDTISAFELVHDRMSEFKHEYEIEAEFNYRFRKEGGEGHAYDPIVAAGARATTLHYAQNNGPIKSRQLVLIDVGARKKGYAADLTRTYIKGEPTKRQRLVHDIVREVQQFEIGLMKPGANFIASEREARQFYGEKLRELGLVDAVDDDAIYKYWPHASHYLGLDVHDVGDYKMPLAPGMVLTVEPGLYLPEEGIGVRIEDDILITETGNQNLSAKLSTGL